MAARSRNVLYYGREDPPPERQALRVGPLSAIFEEGQLVDIRWRDQDVLLRIYAAVRDQDWNTIPSHLSHVMITSSADSFQITFDARHKENDIDFAWEGNIRGSDTGVLSFSMEGHALTTFWRSRIGFCILHSADQCAAKPFSVIQADGSLVNGVFPERIALGSPISGSEAMRGLTYQAAPGLELSIQFEGDVFQMEDQRAWTDSSYKSFCTPLEQPCPIQITKGTRVNQVVVLRVKDEHPHTALSTTVSERRTTVTLGSGLGVPIPEIGLGSGSRPTRLTELEIQRLRALEISHLRVDLDLDQAEWANSLDQAGMNSRALGSRLEVALFLSTSPEEQLKVLLETLHKVQPPICRWLLFRRGGESDSEHHIRLASDWLRSWDASVPVGSGTDAYFYQLTAFRPPERSLDFVSFAIQPQEHASDCGSLIESLKIQRVVVNNARQLFGALPVRVGPVTLKPRFNPNTKEPKVQLRSNQLPAQVDVRQMSLFGACWTLGSIKYLSEGGVAGITYYEATGWRGVMEQESGSPLPEQFPTTPGCVFPLYHVLADIGEFAGGEVLPGVSSDPLKVECLTICLHERKRTLVGNMTGQAIVIVIQGLPAEFQMKLLDESTVWNAMVDPESYRGQTPRWQASSEGRWIIELRPYSILRIDSARD
jgi:D-apionolactonase